MTAKHMVVYGLFTGSWDVLDPLASLPFVDAGEFLAARSDTSHPFMAYCAWVMVPVALSIVLVTFIERRIVLSENVGHCFLEGLLCFLYERSTCVAFWQGSAHRSTTWWRGRAGLPGFCLITCTVR